MLPGFTSASSRSFGIHFSEKIYDALGCIVRVRFLDVDGAALPLGCRLCNDAAAIVICFDVTDRGSFDAVPSILSDLELTRSTHRSQITLVGTKNEDPALRAVTYDEAADYAEENDLEMYETSVQDGSESSDVFAQIVTGVCKTLEVEDEDGRTALKLDPVFLFQKRMRLERPLTAAERIRMRMFKKEETADTATESIDNRWQRAAQARWEKARLAKEREAAAAPAEGERLSRPAALKTVSAPRPRISRSSDGLPPESRKRKHSSTDGEEVAKFEEDGELYSLEGNDFKAYKKMCNSVFFHANMITDSDRRKVKDFLVGKYDDSLVGVEDIILNEEISEDGRWREVLVFEMNFEQGKWRKLRRRYPLYLNSEATRQGEPVTAPSTHSKEEEGKGSEKNEPDVMHGEGGGEGIVAVTN
ncbi:Ras- protein Rab-4A [Gonapodya sp. JEL0774]|nr:Ras- protein Rab-4A [Gonapodya sp. JEL0774]